MICKTLKYTLLSIVLFALTNCKSDDTSDIPKKDLELNIKEIIINKEFIKFEKTQLGGTSIENFTIQNKGKSNIKINSISLVDKSAFSLGTVHKVIKVGETLRFSIIFKPQKQVKYNTKLEIKTNYGDKFVSLEGTGEEEKKEEIVKIPGVFFKSALIRSSKINTNGDNEIQLSEAIAVNDGIDFSKQKIEDLTGIEAFINITGLKINNNNIKSTLDLSKNIKIKQLYCNHNKLKKIIVNNLVDLSIFDCSNNLIESELDVSTNSSLKELYCNNNKKLQSLNIDNNKLLTKLIGSDTKINSLNTSKNSQLVSVNLTMTSIESLDFSKNKNLTTLNCENNFTLKKLNLANGENGNTLNTVNIKSNFSLSCVKIDKGFTPLSTWKYKGFKTPNLSPDCN